MSELLAERNRFIVPFRFGEPERSKRDYIMFLERKQDRYRGKWIEDSVCGEDQDLYGYVLESFDDRGRFLPGNIGAAFRYKLNTEGKSKALIRMIYHAGEKGGDRNYFFDVTRAGMMLFVTGVGFFWYDVSTLEAEDGGDISMDDEILFTFRFKELNFQRNRSMFRLRDEDRDFSMGDWVAEVITSACPGATFFAQRKNILTEEGRPQTVPDKALMYQYAAYDADVVTEQSVIEALYYRTKGYGRNYQIPDDFEQQIQSPFDNVRWFAAKEGVGYFAWAGKKEAPFFSKEMPYRFLGDYFILYMLALNEQYTMLRFAERMAEELPSDPQAYLTSDLYLDVTGYEERDGAELLDLERKVTRLSTEINVFFVKNVRSSVSFIEHHDRFYNYIIEKLRIRDDTNQIMHGLKALQMLLRDVVRQEEFFRNRLATQTWRREKAYQKLEEEKEILRQELYHDPTTGLYNKNGLKYYGRKLYTEARENGRALFVCVADMNGLKYINDNFGHEEGDAALIGTADILRKCILEGDYAFRQGGDEFLVMGLRDAGCNEEKEFSERAEKAMRDYNERLKDDRYKVAMSYGPLLVDMKESKDDLDTLLDISDKRMYEMKMKRDEHRRD